MLAKYALLIPILTSLADYVWLPVRFVDGVPKIEWLDEWTIEELIK
jgi:hypothetical protein